MEHVRRSAAALAIAQHNHSRCGSVLFDELHLIHRIRLCASTSGTESPAKVAALGGVTLENLRLQHGPGAALAAAGSASAKRAWSPPASPGRTLCFPGRRHPWFKPDLARLRVHRHDAPRFAKDVSMRGWFVPDNH